MLDCYLIDLYIGWFVGSVADSFGGLFVCWLVVMLVSKVIVWSFIGWLVV